ncbi:RNA polymerase subunit sigma-24 [Pseudonocardia sp. CNS-139]|nr:RNA polymerase subunit sigma-24 [Pseudonocardia sp. CNS-139]
MVGVLCLTSVGQGAAVQVDEVFAEHRALLFTVAYEILGSAADAEDVLQDSYLRWVAADPVGVEHPRAYLVQVVTRQALNQLRARARRREDCVGAWLPEPIRTGPDAAEDAVLAESISIAMLLLLETLTPDERAVFVLREVFGFAHREIGEAVGRTEESVRQIAHRARSHVQARRKRFDPRPQAAQQIADRFLAAATTGDIQSLMDLMAPDVVVLADGGGRAPVPRSPLVGRERVARFVAGAARRGLPDMSVEIGRFNGLPALLFGSAGRPDSLLVIEPAGGLVGTLYLVRDPEKLARAGRSPALTR